MIFYFELLVNHQCKLLRQRQELFFVSVVSNAVLGAHTDSQCTFVYVLLVLLSIPELKMKDFVSQLTRHTSEYVDLNKTYFSISISCCALSRVPAQVCMRQNKKAPNPTELK